MRSFVLVSEKSWHEDLFNNLVRTLPAKWTWLRTKEEFTPERLEALKPEKIFIPHWSHLIPAEIYSRYECIVFHMTDLPFGRGGSPLQSLIVRGLRSTKLSAIRIDEGIDTGDVYLKKDLSLEGTAQEIFIRAAVVMEAMIAEILERNIVPLPQTGEPVVFKRRKPEESNIAYLKGIEEVYDYIRMLDCEGYPPAFLEIGEFRLEFNNATLEQDKTLTANVRIIKK